jgi:hypothetical protein
MLAGGPLVAGDVAQHRFTQLSSGVEVSDVSLVQRVKTAIDHYDLPSELR